MLIAVLHSAPETHPGAASGSPGVRTGGGTLQVITGLQLKEKFLGVASASRQRVRGLLQGSGRAGDSLRAHCSGVRALAVCTAGAMGDWPGNVTAVINTES